MAKTLVALIAAICFALPAFAQSRTATGKPVKPAWAELTPAQQQILAPLAREWDSLDATRRKSWLTIASRYPKMTVQEQQRLQQRMKEWVALTPEQRRAARERYQFMRKLPPDKRKEIDRQWREYQRSLTRQPELSPSDPPAPPETAVETPATDPPAEGPAQATEAPAAAQ
ncbi:MAG: DUF3106 domain-containing protein [Burkholderiales bacterium]|nr:DUF3106 domain-containing protein [Burkholderiales bacterium]